MLVLYTVLMYIIFFLGIVIVDPQIFEFTENIFSILEGNSHLWAHLLKGKLLTQGMSPKNKKTLRPPVLVYKEI